VASFSYCLLCSQHQQQHHEYKKGIYLVCSDRLTLSAANKYSYLSLVVEQVCSILLYLRRDAINSSFLNFKRFNSRCSCSYNSYRQYTSIGNSLCFTWLWYVVLLLLMLRYYMRYNSRQTLGFIPRFGRWQYYLINSCGTLLSTYRQLDNKFQAACCWD